MKSKILFLLLPIALMLTSCLSSGYYFFSYREPGTPIKIYKKVCVFADVSDPFAKQELELIVGKTLYETGMNAIPAYSLMPPTRDYSNDEIHEILTNNGFDGFIKISLDNVEEKVGYVPATSTSRTIVKEEVVKDKKRANYSSRDSKKKDQKASYSNRGNKKKITTEETIVTNTPGYQYSYFAGNLTVNLIDIQTSQIAFVQNIHSGGSNPQFKVNYLAYEDVQYDIAETIVRGLQKEGFLPREQ